MVGGGGEAGGQQRGKEGDTRPLAQRHCLRSVSRYSFSGFDAATLAAQLLHGSFSRMKRIQKIILSILVTENREVKF